MFENEPPLLSVIIPTYNRADYLPRAVRSALDSARDGNVEVIVVPNGGDESWKESLADYFDNEKVIISPIVIGHASGARNHGLKLARGEYIRFLDDDDYLYAEKCQQQIDYQITNNLDISYAYIDSINKYGKIIKKHKIENISDFLCAVFLSFSTPQHGYLYKKNILDNVFWDISINKRQDLYWLFHIAIYTEPKFSVFSETVGVWFHHEGLRVSKGHSVNQTSKETAKRALDVYSHLKDQKRLNEERKIAISSRLWHCLHDGLMFEPLYWIKISFIARKISKKGKPATPVYQTLPNWLNPLVWELLIVPIRWVKVLTGHHYSN